MGALRKVFNCVFNVFPESKLYFKLKIPFEILFEVKRKIANDASSLLVETVLNCKLDDFGRFSAHKGLNFKKIDQIKTVSFEKANELFFTDLFKQIEMSFSLAKKQSHVNFFQKINSEFKLNDFGFGSSGFASNRNTEVLQQENIHQNFFKFSKKEQGLELDQKSKKKGNVVIVSNLKNCLSEARNVWNVFSTYGKIKNLGLLKNKGKAFIEFVSFFSATMCVFDIRKTFNEEHSRQIPCQGGKFFNKKANQMINANFSHYKEITQFGGKKKPNSARFNEYFQPTTEMHRFKNQFYCPISSKILVDCKSEKAFNLHFKVSEVKKMIAEASQILWSKNMDSSNHGRFLILFQMKSKKDAMIAVSRFHQLKNCDLEILAHFYHCTEIPSSI